MSGFKDTFKNGWHPKGKDGKSKESWRGDFKGINQVAGWVGKGKDPKAEDPHEHISRPLSTLKDPALFGPPPKNVNYHGGAALPNKITPDTRGIGAPISQDQIQAKREAEEEARRLAEEEEERRRASPPVPYRANTTGLSTTNLPPPPVRRDGADGRTPVDKPKPPGLPPRLPPRQNSSSVSSVRSNTEDTEPPSHRGILNQGSINRLGAAGISVPGFEIGGSNAPPPPPTLSSRNSATSPKPTANTANTAQLNELQSRFSRLSASTTPNPVSSSEGTSFAQKQSALKTASSFRKDPSSVSFSDMKDAASTANNFRERHGEQVASGLKTANNMNTKYGIADKVSSYGGVGSQEPAAAEPASPGAALASKKKPPPPPPKKRAELAGSGVSSPPPVPLGTRPNFQ